MSFKITYRTYCTCGKLVESFKNAKFETTKKRYSDSVIKRVLLEYNIVESLKFNKAMSFFSSSLFTSFLELDRGFDFLMTDEGKKYLLSSSGIEFLSTPRGKMFLEQKNWLSSSFVFQSFPNYFADEKDNIEKYFGDRGNIIFDDFVYTGYFKTL